MEKKKIFEGFLIQDEHSFQKEQVDALIERCKKFAMLGKKGNVHIIAKKLSITDKAKLFLITRFLGSKLAELEPSLGIEKSISDVHSSELAKFLSVSEDNVRTRISDLVQEGFGNRPKKAHIHVLPHKIEEFLESLESKEQNRLNKGKDRTIRKSKRLKEKKEIPTIKKVIIEEVVKRLSINLGTPENKIKDCIFIEENGDFKFNKLFTGKSKHAKQIKCILCSAYVLTIGLGLRTFSSRQVTNVCFNSNVDVTGLNYAIRELKNRGKISKAGRHSQDNIILERGKEEAKKIFSELC